MTLLIFFPPFLFLTLCSSQVFQDEVPIKGGHSKDDSKFEDGGGKKTLKQRGVPGSLSQPDAVWILPANDAQLQSVVETAYHHVLSDVTGPHADSSSLQGKDLKAVLLKVFNPNNKMDISAPELLEFDAQVSAFSARQGLGGEGGSLAPLPLRLLQQYSALRFLREVSTRLSRIRAIQKHAEYLKHAKDLRDEV